MSKYITCCFLVVIVFLSVLPLSAAEHPSLIITKKEGSEIREALTAYPLLKSSFDKMKQDVEYAVSQPMDVPLPGEAGGYEHEKHKQNYRDMQQAGILFTITGDVRYAQFIRNMLMAYADLYPTLGPHPNAQQQAPGKLFHQMLNETVWLTYTSQAYDCIYDWLSPEDRAHFEKNIFRPIIEWFTIDNAHEFDRIHNHGTWSVASIGMIGYVIGDQNLVDMALYGTNKTGEGGFLKQLDLLFSPDGYYMEGPYYTRYAMRPFFLFAEAIERNQPEIGIYKYRDQILKKGIYSALQTTFPDGIFPPINDASQTMDINDPGVLYAADLAYLRYGRDTNLLGIVKIQQGVILNRAGLMIARDYASLETVPDSDWGSIAFTDGSDGTEGGLAILRAGTGLDQSMVLLKYGVHGGGHGHFDKLQFIFYTQGREVIPDYGFGRWINIEPKFGGRYLPENKSYAMQTIAHNTVVVDQKTQNAGDRKQADKMSGKFHFFDVSDPSVQVISARADDYYPGVKMQRTLFLIKDEQLKYPVVVDLYRLTASDEHTYDYPLHYQGQVITAGFEYQRALNTQQALGSDHGYEHLWGEAFGQTDNTVRFTWLDGSRFYSMISAASTGMELIFARTGANDPQFNLRSEPMLIRRNKGKDFLFATVYEPHGYFNEAAEMSEEARPRITDVKIIGHNREASVVEITGKNNLSWRVIVNNGAAAANEKKMVKFENKTYSWQGNFLLERNAVSVKK